ncbi:glycosyltransferase [Bacillus phage 015DV002]|nr:glycosyltransferase [Bacillus phage 015DV002]
MTNIKSQDPISMEDLQDYFRFVVHKDVKDEKHAKKIKRISRRVITMSDATMLYKALDQYQENLIGLLMETISVQESVLRKLGATDDMFKEAAEEYTKAVEETVKEQTEVKEKLEAAKEEMEGK